MNAETHPKTACPPPDMLGQLLSGSLSEQYADKLFRHIDDCSPCQEKMDQLDSERDLLAEFAKAHANDSSLQKTEPDEEQQKRSLDALIRKAQQEARSDDTQSGSRSGSTRVGWDDFIHGFRRCGLLSGEEVESCLHDIKSDESVNFNDSGELARALVNRRKLTSFQARVLLRGRWKGLVLGSYAILDSLGQGGMGNVFRARHKRLGRVVCLKVINSAGRQSPVVIDRFRNEAKALARLSHPHIVTAHDAGESKGVPFLVMEYIEGSDLAKHVRAHGPLPVDQALQAMLQTARALEYAHGQGVIHRDVKPHNLFLVNDPKTGKTIVKVLDLGLARFDTLMIDNPDASLLAAMTNTGVVIGTVDYMSPEQALDSRTADARSDIYSLGCTLHFLLTGRPPYVGETMMQRLVAHREQAVPSLSDAGAAVPMNVETCLQQMLAKDPDQRYQSMALLADDLQRMLDGESLTGVVAPVVQDFPDPPPAPRKIRRKQTPAYKMRSRWESVLPVLAATCALSLALAGIYLTLGQRLLTRTGADLAIQNGGDGRALVLVSHDGFDESGYKTIVGTLRAKGYDVVTATPKEGKRKEEFGFELKQSTTNIRLSQFRATDYDAVFFTKGDLHDLKHMKENFERVKSIVKESRKRGLLLASVAEGCHVLAHTGLIADCELHHEGPIKIGKPADSSALVIQVWDSKDLPQAIDKSHAVLSERKKEADSKAPWWQKLL